MAKLTESQYRILVVFRRALREYLHWSATEAAKLGLSPQQQQLLLAIRGHAGPVPPSTSKRGGFFATASASCFFALVRSAFRASSGS